MTDTAGQLHDTDAIRKIANRLKRAQGQLAAVISAVENGGDCRDVVTQLSAVSSALDRAGFAIISTAMRQCLITDDADSADDDTADAPPRKLTVEELEKLFLTLA
ncbi:metal-sensitive transcriptional regulator [Rathayibacter sp. VKM Ac-2929]|uniref:metal-sensitive transcriptional regulator n=1 Tax=Rathayibacter TaxID=33886 RepID=UPI001FB441EE|nr:MULTISPECIES: metal-sensitive transcriptional regulator [Rathayibacter]MCJ1675600.1 metal-sensitive transcriptional regulator [Rathayibacter sp. VKM Ac-2929]MCJ1698052.1 metal-sensitive transcriptional regulator [Rathayibacter caricis]